MPEYLAPADTARIEYEVKKSRFIAVAGFAANREQAMALLEEARTGFADARHHCWAYQLGNPASASSAAMSDDGEPSGTAGRPILNVLQHKGIGDVMVVVSRYFGGIKLGAGGLVRAYSTATQQVIDNLPVRQQQAECTLQVQCKFSAEQAVRYWLGQHAGRVDAVEYAAHVSITVTLPESLVSDFMAFAHTYGCSVSRD